MEHEQHTTSEASSSTGAYFSVLEDLGATSLSECRDAGNSTSSRYWTAVDPGRDGDEKDDEGFVCVLPGAKDNEMEHEQRTINEASSSTGAYFSVLEDLGATSSSECRDAENSTSSRYWTTVDLGSDSDDKDDEDFVCVLPGAKVRKFETKDIKLLEKIGEGGQGIIYAMELTSTPENEHIEGLLAAKMYRGRRFGRWPEGVFHMYKSNLYICQFYGYCLEGESFYLVMQKYECSLREDLDMKMKQAKFNGRPFSDFVTLVTIVQIAIGMWYLHENNIIHRDLKADNIFVIRATRACIGDFDVAFNVVGTLFWRAPEVLQALKDRIDPVFTPKADVYSFAMTCYEILTGGVPLKGVKASDYDAVLLHKKRPKLPSNLNPKVKNLITRCWDQDPEARPTSKEIALELKGLHRELITGSERVSRIFDGLFTQGRSMVDPPPNCPEACLLELKSLLPELLVKYKQADFLVLCVELVADIEQYHCEFGLRSICKEDPRMPFLEWFARKKMCDSIIWRYEVYKRLQPSIVEAIKILLLLFTPMEVIEDVSKNRTFLRYDHKSQISEYLALVTAYDEECQARELPDVQYDACFEHRAKACDLCNPKPHVDAAQKAKYCLYVDSGFAFTQRVSDFFSRG